jgi:DNA-binding NarL/FixJ family response regulator
VLILTTFGDEEAVALALRSGASGFALKDAPGEELQQAVRAVAAGEGWLDPAVTPHVLASFRAEPATAAVVATAVDLTAREVDVLKLVGRGESNAEIGRQLFVSEATVKTYVSRLLAKLELANRTQAAILAHEAGLLDR